MATLDHRHLPPYLTDRLLAGVLPPEVAAAVTRQEQTCDACRVRLEEARSAESLYLAAHPPDRCARELWLAHRQAGRAPGGGVRRAALVWGLPALSAAATVALFIYTRPAHPPVSVERSAEGEAAAREPTLGFSVQRPGSAGPRPGRSGETLRPGDRIALRLHTGRFAAAHVFSIDHRGQVGPVLDWSPARPEPPTLTIDDAPGPERIVVLFHNLPEPKTDLPRLRDAIARTYTAAAAGGTAEAAVPPPDGREIVAGTILIRKELIPTPGSVSTK